MSTRSHASHGWPADFVRLLMTAGVGLLLGLIYMGQVGGLVKLLSHDVASRFTAKPTCLLAAGWFTRASAGPHLHGAGGLGLSLALVPCVSECMPYWLGRRHACCAQHRSKRASSSNLDW